MARSARSPLADHTMVWSKNKTLPDKRSVLLTERIGGISRASLFENRRFSTSPRDCFPATGNSRSPTPSLFDPPLFLHAKDKTLPDKRSVLLLERIGGIGPPLQPWEGRVLPLYDTRNSSYQENPSDTPPVTCHMSHVTIMSERRESNPRPLPWQGSVLPLNYSRGYAYAGMQQSAFCSQRSVGLAGIEPATKRL